LLTGGSNTGALSFTMTRIKKAAEASKQELAKWRRFQKSVATEILRLGKFYEAEEAIRITTKKHALKYKFYSTGPVVTSS